MLAHSWLIKFIFSTLLFPHGNTHSLCSTHLLNAPLVNTGHRSSSIHFTVPKGIGTSIPSKNEPNPVTAKAKGGLLLNLWGELCRAPGAGASFKCLLDTPQFCKVRDMNERSNSLITRPPGRPEATGLRLSVEISMLINSFAFIKAHLFLLDCSFQTQRVN